MIVEITTDVDMVIDALEKEEMSRNRALCDTEFIMLSQGIDTTEKLLKDIDVYGLEQMGPALDLAVNSMGYTPSDDAEKTKELLDKFATTGQEYLDQYDELSMNNMVSYVMKSIPLMLDKSKRLKNIADMITDVSGIDDYDFNNLKLFGQSKAAMETTVATLRELLARLIIIWDKIRRGENVARDAEVLRGLVGSLGYTTKTAHTAKFGEETSRLVYSPTETGFEPLRETSLKEKGYSKFDPREVIDKLLEKIYKMWTLRKSQWWVDVLMNMPQEYRDIFSGSNENIMNKQTGALILSVVNIWCEVFISTLNQMTALVLKMDKIK